MTGDEAMPAEVRLEGFREPKQERSRRTLVRIAGATESLLVERGPQRITVEDVVALADTSVGSFYARFDSKQVAVSFVRERSWRDARRLWREFLAPEAWEDVATPNLIAEVIRRYVRVLLAGDRPTRALYLDLLGRADEEGLERVRELDRDVARLVGRLLGEHTPAGSGAAAGTRAAEEGFLRVISGLRDHLLFRPAGDERSLVLRLTQMYAALLDVERPGSYAELLEMCAEARRRSRHGPIPAGGS